jgi:hypothetical protein
MSTETDAIIAEFRALRSELTMRIGKQQDITNYAIAIIAGLLAVARIGGSQSDPSIGTALAGLSVLFPCISIALSAFTLMILDHEMNIAHLSIYIHDHLRPQIASADVTTLDQRSPLIWQWNAYRAARQQHAGVLTPIPTSMAIGKYLITFFLNVLLVWSYWYTRFRDDWRLTWHSTLFLVAVALFIWVLIAALYTGRIYLVMKDSKGESK